MPPWDLILDDDLDGTSNMAIDAALLDEVEHSPEPKTIVRLLSLEAAQRFLSGGTRRIDAAVDRGFCDEHGVDIVHRPRAAAPSSTRTN